MEYTTISNLNSKSFLLWEPCIVPDENIEKHMATLDATLSWCINTIRYRPRIWLWTDGRPLDQWTRQSWKSSWFQKVHIQAQYAKGYLQWHWFWPVRIPGYTSGTDYLDIYMLHRDNTELPVGPIVEKLKSAPRSRLIRCFGGSNWPLNVWQKPQLPLMHIILFQWKYPVRTTVWLSR